MSGRPAADPGDRHELNKEPEVKERSQPRFPGGYSADAAAGRGAYGARLAAQRRECFRPIV